MQVEAVPHGEMGGEPEHIILKKLDGLVYFWYKVLNACFTRCRVC